MNHFNSVFIYLFISIVIFVDGGGGVLGGRGVMVYPTWLNMNLGLCTDQINQMAVIADIYDWINLLLTE